MIAKRPDRDEYFLAMAQVVSLRASCARRRVGCVLVDFNNHVVATGYNGPARGQPHCIDHPCPGAGAASGTNLDACEAIHAEQNALLQCSDVNKISTAYCTTSPCIHCVKLLMNTSCRRIVFLQEYPHAASSKMWLSTAGREWIRHEQVIDAYFATPTQAMAFVVGTYGRHPNSGIS